MYIASIVSDDDSAMRAYLQRPDNSTKGKLDLAVPKPVFLPILLIKLKLWLRLFLQWAQKQKIQTNHAMRLKKYIGCCILENNYLSVDEFSVQLRAPLEYLFNNHKWCDMDWYWAKS